MLSYKSLTTLVLVFASLSGCQDNASPPEANNASTIGSSVAVKLNFRFEPDVPPPISAESAGTASEINPGIQADFDANRPFELVDRTVESPDKKRIAVVYRNIADALGEYRLDMYSPDGRVGQKVTSEAMAVHFPRAVVWSPDSASLAFSSKVRTAQAPLASPTPPGEMQIPAVESPNIEDTPGEDVLPEPTATPTPLVPVAPTGILTYRTQQVYVCNPDGGGVKSLTATEGLIYFYFAWSPDSKMLVALASTSREWQFMNKTADDKGEALVPVGRPRIIEKNGRERRLDDNQTPVQPVWSPDSSKVATGYGNQIRMYDAIGINPTQAAVPLRNQLLIAAQTFERQQRQMQSAETQGEPLTPEGPLTTLPDETSLTSYHPIVEVAWPSEDLLYLQTAYLRRMKDDSQSVRTNSRWHRLVLSPQPAVVGNGAP